MQIYGFLNEQVLHFSDTLEPSDLFGQSLAAASLNIFTTFPVSSLRLWVLFKLYREIVIMAKELRTPITVGFCISE